MDFGANEAPVEVITEDAFGGTYFRDMYSSVKWTVVPTDMERIQSVKRY